MPVWLIPLIPQILQGIQVAINAAPQAIALVGDFKQLFSGMFTKNMITIGQQNAIHAFLDSLVAMSQAGITPPAWQVQPDPGTVVAPAPAPPPPTPAPAITAAKK